MNKNTYEKIVLAEGEMHVYDFGGIRLHAYQTKDPLADEVFVLEKAGRAVVLEPPCFFANNRELEGYLRGRGLTVDGMLLAYHMAGGQHSAGSAQICHTQRGCLRSQRRRTGAY